MSDAIGWTRDEMAARCARDIEDGWYVNLGIGIPELVATHVPEGREFIYHTENGLLGMGPSPADGGEPELINAGKQRVTALAGASYFHHADSFAMIRGVVDRRFTDRAVIDVTDEGFRIIECAPGVDAEYVADRTDAEILPPPPDPRRSTP